MSDSKEMRELRKLRSEEEQLQIVWQDVKKYLKTHMPMIWTGQFEDELKHVNSTVSRIEHVLNQLYHIHKQNRSKYDDEMTDVLELLHLLKNIGEKPVLLAPLMNDINKIIEDLQRQKVLVAKVKEIAAVWFEFEKKEKLKVNFDKIEAILVELFAPDKTNSLVDFFTSYMAGHEDTRNEILLYSQHNLDDMQKILDKFAEMDSRLVEIRMQGGKFLDSEAHAREFGYCLGMFLAILEYAIPGPLGSIMAEKKDDLEMEWNVFKERVDHIIPDIGSLFIRPKINGIMRRHWGKLDKKRLGLLTDVAHLFR